MINTRGLKRSDLPTAGGFTRGTYYPRKRLQHLLPTKSSLPNQVCLIVPSEDEQHQHEGLRSRGNRQPPMGRGDSGSRVASDLHYGDCAAKHGRNFAASGAVRKSITQS